MRLLRRLYLREGIVNLHKRLGARIDVFLARILSVDIKKLKRIGQSCTHTSICLSPYPAIARAIG